MIVEMQPPKQVIGSVFEQQGSEILSSLSKPLKVMLRFANAEKTSQSIASVQVNIFITDVSVETFRTHFLFRQ